MDDALRNSLRGVPDLIVWKPLSDTPCSKSRIFGTRREILFAVVHVVRDDLRQSSNGVAMMDRKLLAQQLRDDAATILARLQDDDGRRIARRMKEAGDLLDGRAERGIEPPRAPDS